VAVTAYKTPGSSANVTGVGTVAWSNPGNAVSSNDSYATAALPSDGSSNYLRLYNYDFSEIPAGAAIDGIEIEAEAKGNTANRALLRAYLCTTSGAVAGSSSYIPPSTATLTTSDALYVAGGASDTWGNSLTDTIVKGSNFGVMLWAEESSGAGSVTVSVDVVRIRVHYTPNNISAAASLTTANAAPSSAAKVAIAAIVSVALAAAAVVATGGLQIKGQGTVSTGAATSSSASVTPIAASSALTTGAATVSAVIESGDIEAAATLTAGNAIVSAGGALPLRSAVGISTDAAGVTSAAIARISGQASITAGAATITGAAVSPLYGTVTATLEAASVSAVGDLFLEAIVPTERLITFGQDRFADRRLIFGQDRFSDRILQL